MAPLAPFPPSPPTPSRSNSTASDRSAPSTSTAPSPPRSPPRSTRIPLAQRFRTIGRASLEPSQLSQHTPTSSLSSHTLGMHQVPHPPSPPDTIHSASPSRGPSAGDDDERREMERERELSHDRIVGGIGAMSSVKALQERERSAAKGVRRQSLGYSFSTPNRAGLEPQRQRVGPKKWLVLVVPPAVLPHSPPPSQVSSRLTQLFPPCSGALRSHYSHLSPRKTSGNDPSRDLLFSDLQTSGFANGYGASGRFAGGILLPLQSTVHSLNRRLVHDSIHR